MKTRSGFDRIKVYLGNRWSREDLPGQPARFQINLAIRDLMVFAGLPLISVILFKACETAVSAGPRARPTSASRAKIDPNNSRTQILNFATVEQSGPFSGIAHRAVGTIVRVIHKLRKYLNGTQIDGLIYICDSGRLAETIRTLYQARLVEKAQRAKHYGDNFFLFSDCFAAGGLLLNRLFNANGESVELENWIHKLISTKWTLRRNSDFKT